VLTELFSFGLRESSKANEKLLLNGMSLKESFALLSEQVGLCIEPLSDILGILDELRFFCLLSSLFIYMIYAWVKL